MYSVGDGSNEDDSELERMLGELSSIVPPKSLPVTDSLTSSEREEVKNGGGEESEEGSEPSTSIDRLALLRKRLEESAEPEDHDSTTTGDSLTRLDVSTRTEEEEEDESSATINILPATPTVPSKGLGFLQVMTSVDRTESQDSLTVEDALIPRSSVASTEDMSGTRMGVAESAAVAIPEGGRKTSLSGKGSSGQGSPCFSPGSHRSTSDASTKVSGIHIVQRSILYGWPEYEDLSSLVPRPSRCHANIIREILCI